MLRVNKGIWYYDMIRFSSRISSNIEQNYTKPLGCQCPMATPRASYSLYDIFFKQWGSRWLLYHEKVYSVCECTLGLRSFFGSVVLMNDPLLGALRLEMRPISTYLLLLLLLLLLLFMLIC